MGGNLTEGVCPIPRNCPVRFSHSNAPQAVRRTGYRRRDPRRLVLALVQPPIRPHSHTPTVVNNFYTLQALVREWRFDLEGCTVLDVFSQNKNELSVALAGEEQDWMVRGSVQRPFLHLFRVEGYSKARRNVATLFSEAIDQRVSDVRIADRDRLVSLDLSDDTTILWQLFGARANAFHVAADGSIIAAFQSNDKHAGTEAPMPYPAPMPTSFAEFEDRWKENRNKTRQAVQSAVPLLWADAGDGDVASRRCGHGCACGLPGEGTAGTL